MESSRVHFYNFYGVLKYTKFMLPQIIVLVHTIIANQDIKPKQNLFWSKFQIKCDLAQTSKSS